MSEEEAAAAPAAEMEAAEGAKTAHGDQSVPRPGAEGPLDMATGGAELRRLVEELKAGTTSASTALATLLRRLAALPVDIDALRRTGVGREANDQWLRTHADKDVRKGSRQLVHRWMEAVGLRAPATALRRASAKPDEAIGAFEEHARKKLKNENADEEANKPAKKKAKSEPPVLGGPNEALGLAFRELARYEFANKAKWVGLAYQKVAKTLLAMEDKVTSIEQVKPLAGFGKNTCQKIEDWLETGTIGRLEEYRKGKEDKEGNSADEA